MKTLNWQLYQKLFLIRHAEAVIQEHYLEDEMKTPMHMSKGGEAIAVGVCDALSATDQIVGTYRSHAIYLAKTGESDRFFAELYGKATGTAKGKAGSMHLTAPELGLICTSAIVGTNIPVGIGAAFANRRQNNGKVVAIFFGDGAIDEGVFWESLNMACLMRLPVLFVCEDNGLAVHIPSEARHGYRSITEVVRQFDCEVVADDTTDVEQIYRLTQQAIRATQSQNRPVFMHLKYYRYLEHVGVFEDFKAGYRSKSAYDRWEEADPIRLQREKLQQWYSEAEISALEDSIKEQVQLSLQRAEEAPFPESHELYEDIYA